MVHLVKWAIILASIIATGVILWMANIIGPVKSPEIRVAENEIQCVAAVSLVDAKREPGVNLEVVRENIAKAVRRYSIIHKTSVCDVFEKGLTMIPVGYKRKGLYLGRKLWFVKTEFAGTAWDSAQVMAKRVLLIPEPLLGGCATHYIRAERTFNESKEAMTGLRQMQPEPKDATDPSQIQFFCPKKK